MKLVLELYGRTLLEAAALSLLLLLLFLGIADDAGERGIFHIAGKHMDTGGTDYASYTDFKKYVAEGQNKRPKIAYDDSRTVKIGTCELADYIHAYDHRGTAISIRVLKCISPDGTLLLPKLLSSQTSFEMGTPGVYTVRVSATDSGKRKSVCEFKVPVGEG